MSYDRPESRFDQNSSDRHSGNGAIAGAARDAYDPAHGKMNWNFNPKETASSSLPPFSLSSGNSGEGATMLGGGAMQNGTTPEQNMSPATSGAGDALSPMSQSGLPADAQSGNSLQTMP